MENASKALVMAGAILIALIIISLALVMYNKWKIVVIKNANLDAEEIQAFNSTFTPYIGKHVSGSDVNALIQKVVATNLSSKNSGDDVKRVKIEFPNVAGTTTTVDKDGKYNPDNARKVKTGGTFYEVEITKYEKVGKGEIISEITVTVSQ